MNTADQLEGKLREYGKLAIAFSGGTDSTVLAEAAKRALGRENVLLLHADSVFLPGDDRRNALEYAATAGLQLLTVNVAPLDHPEVRRNDEQRCYFCKKLIFGKLQEAAAVHGFRVLADGTNQDDLEDYRPGLKAADELEVVHPILACHLVKKDVRALGRHYGLSNADQPASACLASRIPTGTPLDAGTLKKVEKSERFLRQLGFSGLRVRAMKQLAKLELPPENFSKILQQREKIIAGIKDAGFSSVVLDLEGYRQGSMNQSDHS